MSEISKLISDIKEELLFMQELGVDSLEFDASRLRAAEKAALPKVVRKVETQAAPDAAKPPSLPQRAPASKGSRLTSLPSLAARSQKESTRSVPRAAEALSMKDDEISLRQTAPSPESNDTIESIRAEIGHDCTRCKLSTLGRTQVVNSTGNFNAELMFVGEAPGADEDEQGFPFVGRAGQLLTKIIESIDIKREDVFIGNINRCRPPGNRAPEPDETAVCRPFLKREIAVIKPKVIVVLGATAARNLLETKEPIGKLRGHFHDYLGTKVMPTFHPAYLLRDPHKKREVWDDMKKVRDYLTAGQ